jgi:hypothetical protein
MRTFVNALLPFLLATAALASEQQALRDKVPVFSEAHPRSPIAGYLKLGQRVQTASEAGLFVRLETRSGKKLWVRAEDLGPVTDKGEYDLSSDLQVRPKHSDPPFKRLRLDMGGAGGSFQGQSFFEASVGLEYFMMERLSWRNSFFYRFAGVLRDSFGLDSSVRGNGNLPLGSLRLRGLIGAGYRFASPAGSAPFMEVGASAALGGFDVGLVTKFIALSLTDSSQPNVFLYSIVLSGSTAFF